MSKKFVSHPKHPERICWGCEKFCPANSLACGNGSERAAHPIELFGDDWMETGLDAPTTDSGEPELDPSDAPEVTADAPVQRANQ
jgi:hypothetical protein